jgi:hypothetical protein
MPRVAGDDAVISSLSQDSDAEGDGGVRRAGRPQGRADVRRLGPPDCRDIISRTVEAFGRGDVLVDDAAFLRSHETLEEIPRRGEG